MSYKKCLSIIICFLFIITSLAGCKSKAVSSDADANNNSVSNDNKTVAMGRYMETEFPLPEGVTSDNLTSVVKAPNDKLEIYTFDGDNSTFYCYSQKDDGSYDKTEQPWLSSQANNLNIIYGEDGNLYVLDGELQSGATAN